MRDSRGKQLHAGISCIVLEGLEPEDQQTKAIFTKLQRESGVIRVSE